MWVLLPVQSTLLWATLEENEFFALQEHKAAHTVLQGVMNSFRTTLGGEKNPYLYRIILKSRDNHHYDGEGIHQLHPSELALGDEEEDQLRPLAAAVVAVGDKEGEVREHWKCLEEQITQQLRLFDQTLRAEERELRRFLHNKLAGLALKQREQQRKEKDDLILLANGIRPNPEGLSRDKHFRNLHRATKVLQASKQAPWHQYFAELARHEELTLCCRCILLRRSERKGRLFVSGRHVCFYGRGTKLIIPWVEVSSLARTAADNGSAIYLATSGGEFIFTLRDQDQTLMMMKEIWHMTLDNMARKVTADFDIDGPSYTNASVSRSALPSPSIPVGPSPRFSGPVSPRFSSPPSPLITVAMTLTSQTRSLTKEMLQTKIERDLHRKLFRLSTDENLINQYQATVWMTSFYHQGSLSITPNFACFHSENHDEVFTVIINFRDVQDVKLVDGRLILIQTLKNKFSFSFLARRKHAYELLHSTWSSNRWLVSQESLPHPPPLPPFANNFVGPGQSTLNNWEQFRPDYRDRMKKQKETWDQYINKNGWGGEMIQTSHLTELVAGGIPDEYRGMLWQRFLGSIFCFNCKRGEYQNILKIFHGKQSLAISEIARDVHRSFPDHPYFQTKAGRDALQRVLTAYSWRNQNIGYCQSMNIICALLLLYMGEEEAFWVLRMLCEEYLPQYWTPDMIGSITDQHVFEDLVEEHLPEIDAHLSSIDLPLALVSFPWFVCLFIGYVPMEVGLRILDHFFYEGYETTFLFKVALAVLKLQQDELLDQVDGFHVCNVLKRPSVDCEILLSTARNDFGGITREKVEELRDHHRSQILKEMEESKAKENSAAYSAPALIGGSSSTPSSPATSPPTRSRSSSGLRSGLSASSPDISRSYSPPKREITLADIMTPSPPSGATELAMPRQRQVRGSTAPMLPRSQLRSADSSPVPSNPDSLANSPVTPFHFERDLGSSGGTGTSTTAQVAASRPFRLPDSDVAGSAVVAAAVRSPPRPDFVPKLALGQPEAGRGTEAAADNQHRPLVNELSLEQILEEQTELPLAKPGPRLASVMFRKRSFSSAEVGEAAQPPWQQRMSSHLGQAHSRPDKSADAAGSSLKGSGNSTAKASGSGEEETQFSPVLTRQRSSSSADMIPSPRRQACNSQHILDVLTVAQQVGSKAITDDQTKAVDMVRQLRISEIHQLRDSMKRVRVARGRLSKGSVTHRELRRMATDGGGLLSRIATAKAAAAAAASAPRTPPARLAHRSGITASESAATTSTAESGTTPLTRSDVVIRPAPCEVDADGDEGNDGDDETTAAEEQKVRLAEAGVKGVVEDGEGEEETDIDDGEQEEEDDDEEEEAGVSDQVDSTNLHYVQNFLLRRRNTEHNLFSLTRRLRGSATATSDPALPLPLRRHPTAVVLHEYDDARAKQAKSSSDEEDEEEEEEEEEASSDDSD